MNQPNSLLAIISQTIEKLRQLTQVDVQADWRYYSQDLEISLECIKNKYCQDINFSQWHPVQLNDKGYITWSAGHKVRWLAQKVTIPENLQVYPLAGLTLRLVLTWWAENAQIYVNGKLLQEGDLFDSSSRILLTRSATPGEEIIVALRLVSPGHDIGALMRSQCVYEREKEIDRDRLPLDPGWVADELTVLHKYLAAFEPDQLEILAAEIGKINWDVLSDTEAFDDSLSNLRQNLYPLCDEIKQRCIHLLGHAHLDLAWLWPVSETWEVAQRTFESVLNLQTDFPYLTFCHTTPALYAWLEKHCPDLFRAIQQAVTAGVWEILGGMWVEPEVNIVGGESLVRQLLYGQRYIQEKFGAVTKIAWLPDSFGFCWQLPQILQQSGIQYFVTGKLHWNDSTTFPHGVFWWRSPDGTQILTTISPPNLTGVMDTNPITMANYAIDWELQTGLKDIFWLPGVGDHGGGPSRDMLRVYQRSSQSPFFPRLEFTRAIDYLQQISTWERGRGGEGECGETRERGEKGGQGDNNQLVIPIWNDELYLEFHRGCYTTHADQKRFNRRGEELLYQAELWASLATIISTENQKLEFSYPKAEIEEAWKKLLFNQFHDILPGTSIPEVFVEANQAWQEVERVGNQILSESLQAIASQINLPSPPKPQAKPVIVFNSLNWKRSEVVTCTVTEHNWKVYNLEGEKIPSQRSKNNQLLFLAKDIPSVGYKVFWLCQDTTKHQDLPHTPHTSPPVLENEVLRVVIDLETGDLSSIFDKTNRREVLKGAGNQLQAFQDRGQYWDAWNIDPNYAQHPLPPTQLKSIQWLECGPLQWRVRVVRKLGKSEFCQDYILQTDSPILKIATTVDWQESHVLVKANFLLNLQSDRATYEIPCAAIERPTSPQTTAQKAKWEVPALRWADLTDDDRRYGVSLLNDCKYGYDSQPSQLRLTLMRSPTWPDPTADRGIHQFTYAVYPHSGSWQLASTVRRSYEFNIPLIVRLGDPIDSRMPKHLPAVGRLLDLQVNNLVLMALKPAEDRLKTWILRCYECHGEVAELSFYSDLGLRGNCPVDLLEQPLPASQTLISGKHLSIQPWKIVSLEIVSPNSNPR